MIKLPKTAERKIKLSLILLLFIGALTQTAALNKRINLTKPLSLSSGVFDTSQTKTEQRYWSDQISLIGGSDAYRDFKKVYADNGSSLTHLAAHLFGVTLYEKLGLTGMTVCDQSFAYGCFHGFFSKAIRALGLAVVPQINQTCLKNFGPLGTACLHGIGHGLMEYFGPDKLSSALEQCSLTTQSNPLFGCATGVFMEYFSPTIVGQGTLVDQSRPFGEDRPYEVCPEITNQYQRTCYFQIPQWWNRVLRSDFSRIGLLCQDAFPENNRRSCFLGTGNDAAIISEFNLVRTTSRCRLMPGSEGVSLCLAGASWSFLATPAKADLAPRLCAELPIDQKTNCVKESDLKTAKSQNN